MKAPERIWVCPDLIVPQDKKLRVIEGAEKTPDWTCGTFWEGDPPDYPHGQMYHHDDTVTALQAEVDRLREAARAVIEATDKWNAEQSREAFGAMSRAIDATRAALSGDDT